MSDNFVGISFPQNWTKIKPLGSFDNFESNCQEIKARRQTGSENRQNTQ